MNEFDPLQTEEKEKESLHRRPRRIPAAFSEEGKAEPSVTEAEEALPEAKESASEAVTEETSAETEAAEISRKDKKEKPEEPSLSVAGNIFDWCKSFLFSLTAVIFIFTLLFRGVTVNGHSMLPTLQDGEYLIISNLFYAPDGGDVVVVQAPHYKNGTEPLVKRVIATEGQEVKINFNTWEVWVDGEKLTEDYILFEPDSSMLTEDMETDENGVATVIVQENCVFLMGDHRNDSLDSRSDSVGQIDVRYIMGRVILRVTPFERFGKVK